jgi:RNA polymerase sigma-70 factor (ECF subfamily)
MARSNADVNAGAGVDGEADVDGEAGVDARAGVDGGVDASADADAGWHDAVRGARDAYPDIRADARAFAAHAEACRPRGARVEHLAELYLAWAAGRGDAAALRHVERLIAPEADAAARRFDRSPQLADEVRQAVRVRLLVAEGGRVRIADYVGRGPLRGWLGVVAVRTALNLRRGRPPAEGDLLADLVGAEADPELRHMKTLYRAELRDALEAALRALPERARAVLRLCYVDGMKLVQLARLYGVHETTAARWVSRAAADVAEDARRRLAERLALSPESLDSIARMVMSHLDLSIARVLAG